MKVSNMTSSRGNVVANQFIIFDSEFTVFQSYDSVIVKTDFVDGVRRVQLDESTWNYSVTTARYRNQFLGESTKETQAKIDSGEYILTDLNGWIMQNLEDYSDQELSLQVFNDEGLYNIRHDTDLLFEVLDQSFVYNQDQKAVLLADLEDDL